MYDHGFMDNTNCQAVHETMVVHMTWVWTFSNNYNNHPRMCVWGTLCGKVDKHSPFDIYIWFYIGSDHRYLNRFEWITLYMCDLYYHRITTTNGCFVDGILSVDYSTNELFRQQISWNFMCMTYSVICGYFSNSTHRNILWLDTFHIWHYQIGMGY